MSRVRVSSPALCKSLLFNDLHKQNSTPAGRIPPIFCRTTITSWALDAQNRHKKALRAGTAVTRRYVLNKFITDCSINRVSDITLPVIQRWLVRLKNDGKSADTCWTYGQRFRSFVTYLVPKYVPATILEGFTVPEPSAIGRKNWLHKDEITKIIEAAGDDLDSSSLFTAASMPVFDETKSQKLKSGGLI